jgi:hypothetical protein
VFPPPVQVGEDFTHPGGLAPLPPPRPTISRPTEPFKLPPITDAKSYLNLTSIINYYLCRPEFSTLRSDDLLITDAQNAEAS